jgi:hypothetical protein
MPAHIQETAQAAGPGITVLHLIDIPDAALAAAAQAVRLARSGEVALLSTLSQQVDGQSSWARPVARWAGSLGSGAGKWADGGDHCLRAGKGDPPW